MIDIIIPILVLSAAVAAGIAVYKHGSLTSVKAAVATQAASLEAAAVKVEGEAKTAIAAVVARLKAI